jgi:hypothetical protein
MKLQAVGKRIAGRVLGSGVQVQDQLERNGTPDEAVAIAPRSKNGKRRQSLGVPALGPVRVATSLPPTSTSRNVLRQLARKKLSETNEVRLESLR